ncbi:adenylate kinase, putative [Trypanosoma equiperdum]|uniref:Adenylate kinase, putative n=2 Tax=Trypanozoon TaxID=39700 RepID=Q38B28_TRYB2|nr:adenylate kinase, putative [Trypanosoma brucei brucei TREU927]EAN77992.1 adenylate kinase, putative [Trypanosoma brucei brucei TREU927]SCU68982.1 adenylate kinase, putative [Trypanosoma equiperdum]
MGLHILLFGAPGCGKGTASEFLVRRYDFIHVSTGNLLREEVKKGSAIGRQVEGLMSEGQLIPDHVVVAMIINRLQRPDTKGRGILLDGFPRTRAQAETLAANGFKVDAMIFIDVDEIKLEERCVFRRLDPVTGRIYNLKSDPSPQEIMGRLLIRSDDNREKHRRRMQVYLKQKASLMEYYRGKVLEVDGNPPLPVVLKSVATKVDELLRIEKSKL